MIPGVVRRHGVSLTLLVLAAAGSALAASAAPLSGQEPTASRWLQDTVRTATTRPTTLFRTTYSATILDAGDIRQTGREEVGDLLQHVPGFYVESSSGVSGDIVWPRGLPQSGSLRYVTVQRDGLPVVEAPDLIFASADAFFRLDPTVERVEVVRGGPAAVFASNAPGGVVNFISAHGGDELSGDASLTVGDRELFRTEAGYGGPLAEKWRFHVGGFYRSDGGVRQPGFIANRGGQIRGSLTRRLENGYVRLTGRYLDDRNLFHMPVPLLNPDDPRGVPGFDPNHGTLASLDVARVKIPTPGGPRMDLDLSHGLHPTVGSVGLEARLDLAEGWTADERLRFTSGETRLAVIVPTSRPQDALEYADARRRELGLGPAAQPRYSYPKHPRVRFLPETANGNGLVMEAGWWWSRKPIRSFSNDFRVSRELGRHEVTAGLYYSDFSADDFQSFSRMLLEVRSQPRLLDLQFTVANPENPTGRITQDGFLHYGTHYRNATAEAQLATVYLADAWRPTDRLAVDAGLRLETARFDGNVEGLRAFNLFDPRSPADDRFIWGNDRFLPFNHTFEEVGYSGGASYVLSDRVAVFGRVSEGFRMPDFEEWTDGSVREAGRVEDLFQAEAGVRLGTSLLGVSATAFFSSLQDLSLGDRVADPGTGEIIGLERTVDAEALGAEVQLRLEPLPRLALDVAGTVQRPELTNVRFDPDTLPDVQRFDVEGNQSRRVPEVTFTARPSYTLPDRFGGARVFGTVRYVGERFADDENRFEIPAFTSVEAGLSLEPSDALTVQVRGTNLLNVVGLTAMASSPPRTLSGGDEVFLARPIHGRSIRISLSYGFR